MKKLSLVIIIAFCAGFLLSSCSKLSNISITKRHYRSGFHVDLGSRKHNVSRPQSPQAMPAVAAPSASAKAKDKSAAGSGKTIPVSSSVFIPARAEEKKQTDKKESSAIYAGAQDISSISMDRQAARSYVASLPDIIAADASRSSDAAPMWVIILFAILIPPLGVALKFGITTEFWISLLLTLLFWLPGAIYSVIVVTQ